MNAVPLRVLLIEDDPNDAEFVDQLLHHNPDPRFMVQCDDRLSTGLKRHINDRYDAMLLDLGLPDSQGLKTVETAAEHSNGTPIVVLTGTDHDEELGASAVQLGADDFLPKHNLSRGVLVRAIRYAVERRNLQEQLQRERARRESEKAKDIFDRIAGAPARTQNLSKLSHAYCNVVESYVASVQQGTDRPEELVTMLAERLSKSFLSTRDIVSMHLKSIKKYENLIHSESEHCMKSARLCLVEVLGNVLDIYRNMHHR